MTRPKRGRRRAARDHQAPTSGYVPFPPEALRDLRLDGASELARGLHAMLLASCTHRGRFRGHVVGLASVLGWHVETLAETLTELIGRKLITCYEGVGWGGHPICVGVLVDYARYVSLPENRRQASRAGELGIDPFPPPRGTIEWGWGPSGPITETRRQFRARLAAELSDAHGGHNADDVGAPAADDSAPRRRGRRTAQDAAPEGERAAQRADVDAPAAKRRRTRARTGVHESRTTSTEFAQDDDARCAQTADGEARGSAAATEPRAAAAQATAKGARGKRAQHDNRPAADGCRTSFEDQEKEKDKGGGDARVRTRATPPAPPPPPESRTGWPTEQHRDAAIEFIGGVAEHAGERRAKRAGLLDQLRRLAYERPEVFIAAVTNALDQGAAWRGWRAADPVHGWLPTECDIVESRPRPRRPDESAAPPPPLPAAAGGSSAAAPGRTEGRYERAARCALPEGDATWWSEALEALRGGGVEPYDWKHWISPLELVARDLEARAVVVAAPDESHAAWVEEAYGPALRQAVGEGWRVTFAVFEA